MQATFLNRTVDVADSIFITRDDVEVGSHFHAAITDGIWNVLKIIDSKFLGYHIYDLVAGRDISFILIGYQLVNFTLSDLVLCILANNITSCLQAFDMMSCNTHIHFVDLQVRIRGIAIVQSHPDSFDSFINIKHLPMLHPIGIGAAKPEYLQLTVLILATCNSGYFGSAYIETYDDGLFVTH